MVVNFVKKWISIVSQKMHELEQLALESEAEYKVKYDMVIFRVDASGNETTKKRTYKSEFSRDYAAQRLVEDDNRSWFSLSGLDEGEQNEIGRVGITSVVYEDRMVFWRKSDRTPNLPTSVPRFPGKGKKALRCTTRNGSVVEVSGSSANFKTIAPIANRLEMSFTTVAVIRRRTAFKAKSTLCPV